MKIPKKNAVFFPKVLNADIIFIKQVNFFLKNLHNSFLSIIFVPQMNHELNIVINYNNPGSCCWAAFIKMGALRENSPNYFYLY